MNEPIDHVDGMQRTLVLYRIQNNVDPHDVLLLHRVGIVVLCVDMATKEKPYRQLLTEVIEDLRSFDEEGFEAYSKERGVDLYNNKGP